MKKLLRMVAVATLLATAFGYGTAAADNPEPFEDSVTFPDINPCTGEEFFVTLNFSVREHFHTNNFVANVRRTGTTSDGFVMRTGTETVHFNQKSELAGSQFKDFWTNPETGQKFHVRGNSTVVLGNGPFAPPTEVRVDNFSLRCVRG